MRPGSLRGLPTLHQAIQSIEQAESLQDRVVQARVLLATVPIAAPALGLGRSIELLRRAHRAFAANLLVRERRHTQHFAAHLLLLSGARTQALALTADDQDDHLVPLSERALRLAVRSAALMDDERHPEALAAAGESTRFVRSNPVLNADVLIAVRLVIEAFFSDEFAGRGIRSHLSPSIARAGKEDSRPSPWQDSVLTSLELAAQRCPVAKVNHALWKVVTQSDSDLNLLGYVSEFGLVGHEGREHPLVWLRLGTAFRLQGKGSLAIRCLRQARELAQRNGEIRVAHWASLEISLAQAEQADPMAAFSTLLELRDQERKTAAQAHEDFLADAPEQAVPALAAQLIELPEQASVHLQRAYSYIRDHVEERITVADLERHCGVGRRTLQQAFRVEMNMTIRDLINALRLQAAAYRLTYTNHSVKKIAKDLSYGSAGSLARLFRKATGSGPREYRAMHAKASGPPGA